MVCIVHIPTRHRCRDAVQSSHRSISIVRLAITVHRNLACPPLAPLIRCPHISLVKPSPLAC